MGSVGRIRRLGRIRSLRRIGKIGSLKTFGSERGFIVRVVQMWR